MSERDNDTRGRGNKPVATLRDGALKNSIFRNRGEHGDSYSVAPSRIYTDKETGEVRETTSLGGSEPLRMAHLLIKGHDRIAEYKAEAKRTKETGRNSNRSSGRSRDDGFER